MNDTKEAEIRQKNCNNKINNELELSNEQAGGKSTESNIDICNKNSIETKNNNLQEEARDKNNTKISAENKVEFKNISDSNLKNIGTIIAKVKVNTLEGIKKCELKKHETCSEKASTTTIGGSSCPQILKHIDCNEQEIVNNIEKTEMKNTKSDNKRFPIHFGIKSYLHQFYAPPDKDILKTGDYIQEDDFEFLVEPGKQKWRFWFYMGMCIGLNLLLLGLVILLIGYLTPPRQAVVGYKDNLEIVDRWAIGFNRYLQMCRIAGLCIFCSGAIIVMIFLLVSSYRQETTYSYTCVMGVTVIPKSFIGNPLTGQGEKCINGNATVIPIASTVHNIQPSMLTSHMCQRIR